MDSDALVNRPGYGSCTRAAIMCNCNILKTMQYNMHVYYYIHIVVKMTYTTASGIHMDSMRLHELVSNLLLFPSGKLRTSQTLKYLVLPWRPSFLLLICLHQMDGD